MGVFLFLLWIILNGKVTVEILLFDCLFTAAVLWFMCRFMRYSIKKERYLYKNIAVFLVFSYTVIREIVKAAVAVIRVCDDPAGKPDPVIIEFNSGLKSRLLNVLLANSITLTPGTYTLFQESDHFVVHCLRREYAEGIEDSDFIHILRKIDPEES